MSGFIDEALVLTREDAPAWLEDVREQGRASWQRKTWPTRKTEAWKYTSLRALERLPYLGEPGLPLAEIPEEALRERFEIADLEAAQLVFVNGHYSRALSTAALPEGVEMVQFASADADQAERIRTHLGSVVRREQHLFAALNDLRLNDGLFLRITKDTKVETALQVVWLSVRQRNAFNVSQRLLVVLEEGCQATLIEHFVSDQAEQNCFTNGVTELIVGANAHLFHYRLHLEEEHALHIGSVHTTLGRDARMDSFHLALGGTLKRIDVVVNHDGEGASCRLNGIYLPRHEQHVDYHTSIEHVVGQCTTVEMFRGIISDSACAVFNGRIHIHPGAQKSRAELSNRNLLTSRTAEVDTKPELEIYADDVQCAHGATVAQLDEESVFYLCARGISRRDAVVMLSFGFINELVNKVADQPMAEYLRPIIVQLFAEDSRLARHIL